jgi:hypothetical protein
MRRIAVVAAAGLMAAGCAHGGGGADGRTVLRQGVTSRLSSRVRYVGPNEALRMGRTSRAYFKREIRIAARKNPELRFDSPPRAELLTRLRHEAAEHQFHIVSLQMLHPDQLAPMVIVSTSRYESLARAAAGILKSLNGRKFGRYEGFYFEARDERGVPFFTTETLRRDRVEGGEWARSEALYPFPHG